MSINLAIKGKTFIFIYSVSNNPMLLLFTILLKAFEIEHEVRFIEMAKITQPVKTLSQISELKAKIHSEFRDTSSDPFTIFVNDNRFTIYQLRTRKNLISSLFISHDKYTDISQQTRDVICLFCIVTVEEYRNMGYARKLVEKAVHEYVNSNKIYNPIIALHLDPLDQNMNSNYALYYKFGFSKANVSMYGPDCFKFRLNEIYNFQDVRDAMKNVESNEEKGDKFCMFVEYKDFMKVRDVDMKAMSEEGEVLRKMLLNRVKL